jgi:hypothetical protein
MKKTWRVLLVAALMTAMSSWVNAGEQPSPAEVIKKAIKAHGGSKALDKYKAATFKLKGTSYAVGEDTAFTGEFNVQEPEQARLTLMLNIMGQDFKFVQVVNRTKGWRIIPGKDKTEAMNKEMLEEARGQMYAGWVTRLSPLKDKAFKLSVVGEAQVDGRPALGIRVEREGKRPVNMFFDKKSSLLVKTEFTVKDEFAGDKETMQETIYKDYRNAGDTGLKYPGRVTVFRDGKRYSESEVTEFEALERLDDGVFAEP